MSQRVCSVISVFHTRMRAHAHAGSGPKEGTQVIHVPAPHPTKILPPQRPVAGSCCKRKQPAGSESLTARTASCSHGWHFTLLWVFAAPRGSISQGRVPGTLGGGVMTETPKSLQSDHRSDLSPARAGGEGAGRTEQYPAVGKPHAQGGVPFIVSHDNSSV